MDWILFGLTVPVFYIIGLVTFIRWLSHYGRHAPTATKPDYSSAAAEIRLRAAQYSGKFQDELLAVADSLGSPQPVAADSDAATARFEPGHHNPTHTHAIAHSAPVAPAAPAAPQWISADIASGLHSMDSINLLLFLGAFLVVVSAGIFVGYNFETLSGVFKTVFLGLFAAIFYGVGLALYLNAPKLRPAGNTFTGIGLVMLPLVGLAAFNFTSAHDHAHAVWFVTSLVTLIAYAATLAVTRQTYVAYLMAFTTLSLFESGISLVQVPLFWFGWGMSFVALVLLLVSRWTGWWREAAGSVLISANLFIPVSVIFSLALIGDQGLTQLGVTLGMAGILYGYMASRYPESQSGEVYWLLALTALPAALSVGLWDSVTHVTIAGLLIAVAGLYLALDYVSGRALSDKWRGLMGLMAGLLPLAGALIANDQATIVLGCLVASMVAGGVFAWRLRQNVLAGIAIVAALAVPAVLLRDVITPALGWGWLAAGYLVLTLAMIWWRRLMRGWPGSSAVVGAAGYMLSMAAALITAAISGHVALLLVALLVSGALFWLSYFEQIPEYFYIASAAKYLAFLQIVPITNWPSGTYAMIIILVGSASYVVGYRMNDFKRAQALRYTAIIATLGGSLFGGSSDALSSIASLALGGGLLMAEARRQALPVVEEVAVAILVVAFDWFLGYNHVDQTQLYSIPWAVYFAYLCYRRRSGPRSAYDLFTILALFALTFPIAGQALGDGGQLYGLELIFIGLGLVVVGSSLHYKLVAWWGAGTLIAEVLYQMREVLYALPKYLISAALGLALLGVAIVLLQRRRDH